MRERIWYELTQAKHNNVYCCFLISYWRRILNIFNIVILAFSAGGIMGWPIWEKLPLISCIIIAAISLLRLLQTHLVPTEKHIEKLDQITDFYFDYFNDLEQLWFDFYNYRIDESEAQARFYKIKSTEKTINKSVNEIIKKTNKKILKQTEFNTRNYLKHTFNT